MEIKIKKFVLNLLPMTMAAFIGLAILSAVWIIFPINQADAAQGDMQKMEIWDADSDGYCDTIKLFIDNTNGTTWTAGTNGSALESWQDTGFDGLKGDGNDYF